MTGVSITNNPEDQGKLSKRTLRSDKTIFKNFRSYRFKKSAVESNHKKDKIWASVNFTLSLICLSRVLKATKKRVPWCQRQFKILAEYSKSQNKGLNTTSYSLLLVNAALNRSDGFSNNKKKSSVLKFNLAVDLFQSTRSLPSIPNRKDRISKQKKRSSRSRTISVVNFALILKTDLLQYLSWSKSKGHHKSDLS